ncbi:DNA polymerase III subunit delta [Streptococcus panodentis]|uniref:DNA polymerase III subunit delta n=1 Tax=Streptococcus panodentis TaxID=1581472 RepID=A0ABS5B0B6_9STRE|nr:DNA polymerase III subunit delta [Streptococcus sp. DD11]MBP2622101.1 DNA polymerase III subunit delta [Streptococcus panodentis]
MLAIEEIKNINPAALSALTVLTGDDAGQFELLKEQFLRQLHFDPADLNVAVFDMKEADYQAVELDLVSLPFFADEKIIILDRFADLTTAKKRCLTDEELKSFEDYLENPVATTKLVIFAPGKLDSKRRLVKLLKRDGQIFEASEPKEQELRRYFSQQAQEQGLHFAPTAFDQLLIKSGFHFSDISKNLAFLKGYKESGQIEPADIEEAIPKTLQDNIFDLTQLILQQKIDAARSLVRDLTLQGEDEIKLMAIMLGQFRIFTQVKILWENGRAESQIVTDLSDYLGRKVNPYQVKFALRDAQKLSLTFLKKTLACLIETDYQIKSGLYDKDYLFDLALLKIATGRV